MNNGVLITGAGSGLGRETALHLAGRGFHVYAAIPEPGQHDQLAAAARARGVQLEIIPLDVTDEAGIAAVVDQAAGAPGGLYALINNAGISLRGYFEDLDDDEIKRVFAVNLFGAMAVTRAVLPYLRAAGQGRIIFISSVGAQIGSMARTAYCASKFALEGFAESLMQEVTPLGVAVSIVEPAIVKTERWTVNRGVARRANNPASPYYHWFQRQEQLADALVRSSPTTPAAVAHTIEQALTERHPRLRYIAGWRAALVIKLRRYLPGELFERVYFGAAMRRVAGPMSGGKPVHAHAFAGGARVKDKPMSTLITAIKALGLGAVLGAGQIKRMSDETIRGFYTTRVLAALLNIGFFDELAAEGALIPESFAVQRGLNHGVLAILCDYLYELGILDRDGPFCRCSAKGRRMIESLGGAFMIVYAYEDIFYNLEALLKGDKRYGEQVQRRAEFMARGSSGVGRLLAFPLLRALIAERGYRRVLDLGCGDATFLSYLCERIPYLQGVGLDIAPEAIDAGTQRLEQLGMQQRIELHLGDATCVDTIADRLGYIDAVTMVYVLHEFWSAGHGFVLQVLQKFRRTFPGVPLLICEVIAHSAEAIRKRPGGIMEIQLFHNLSNQQLRSREEWRALFAEAGYSEISEQYFAFVRTAIFTLR